MNKKVYIKRIVSICLVSSAIVLLFYFYLPPKYNSVSYMRKEIGNNRADICIVGSSHVFNGFNPIQMYEDYGISAYVLAAGGQAPWQSYYYVKTANKFQHPDVIILDIYMFGRVESDNVDYRHAVENLMAYPLSLDKILALTASKVENPLDFLLVFPFTHDEYGSVEKLTWDKNAGSGRILGYSYEDEIYEGDDPLIDISAVDECDPIYPKCEEYLRKSIEYCNRKDIKIVLTNTPWPEISEETQRKYNYIASIADEYGIPFLDGCKLADSIGIDYRTDSFDWGHLNYSGTSKWTGYIEKFLIDNGYSLPDRRGQIGYEVYSIKKNELDQIIRSSKDRQEADQ